VTDNLKSRRIKLIVNIVTIVALCGLGYALRGQFRDTLDNFSKVNLWILVFMIPAQAINYLAQAKFYQSMFRIVGDRFRYRSMARLAMELNFVNTVFPSGGVSGFSYISLRLKDEGISTAKASTVQMMRFILIFISVQVLLFFGLIALALSGRANDFVLLLGGIIGTLITVGTFLVAYVIGSKQRINAFFLTVTHAINGLIHLFRRKSPETINITRAKAAFTEMHEVFMQVKTNLSDLKVPFSMALLSVTAEIATIYIVYLAFGQWVNIGAVILAYAVANFAGLVSILPGGIGIYEALMTAVLTAGGVPAAVSLPVTVMYRILNMAIGLPVGYIFYYKTLHQKPTIADEMEETIKESSNGKS
jgi:uncharacterized protein (TIRG00374 family)